MKEEQAKRLEPLYPKWVQFKNEKTLRLVPDQVAIMGQVWSEVTNKRWSGGCQACTVNAFSQVMSLYDAELVVFVASRTPLTYSFVELTPSRITAR